MVTGKIGITKIEDSYHSMAKVTFVAEWRKSSPPLSPLSPLPPYVVFVPFGGVFKKKFSRAESLAKNRRLGIRNFPRFKRGDKDI